eukprot:GHVT01009597.1.p2 GENE.GHVT01009597.1~~GHVT01009597.1.p2  ORF type:complete len:197 (-),score=20.75 GHVT01009597.1:1798-2388(-)
MTKTNFTHFAGTRCRHFAGTRCRLSSQGVGFAAKLVLGFWLCVLVVDAGAITPSSTSPQAADIEKSAEFSTVQPNPGAASPASPDGKVDALSSGDLPSDAIPDSSADPDGKKTVGPSALPPGSPAGGVESDKPSGASKKPDKNKKHDSDAKLKRVYDLQGTRMGPSKSMCIWQEQQRGCCTYFRELSCARLISTLF